MNLTRRLLMACVSLLALALDPGASAQVSARQDYGSTIAMTHTGASLGEIVDGNVAEYYEAKAGKKYPREVVPVYATGGLSSTAEDFCRFGDSLVPGGSYVFFAGVAGDTFRVSEIPAP